jgi:hypothetical protein
MANKHREFLRGGSVSIAVWHCSECPWSKAIVIGIPGEISEEEARAAFDKYVCDTKYHEREDVNQNAARIVREATEKS